jgi:hypothetical protein
MDYIKELEVIQTWIKATAGLNSYRLKEANPKVGRPVILWETPSRGRDRNISQYQYVNRVRRYGKLFVESADQADDIQEKLIKDLEEKQGVLPIKDGVTMVGYLKAITIDFGEGVGLDIPFTIQYEATYGRTRPQQPPPASKVTNKRNITV